MLFIVFSAPVGLHHQFADPGISAGYKWLHGVLTFCVAMPSFITAFTWPPRSSMRRARRGGSRSVRAGGRSCRTSIRDRYLFAYFFAGLVLFFFGGITGIINASIDDEQRRAQHRVGPGPLPHHSRRTGLPQLPRHVAVPGRAADRQAAAIAGASTCGCRICGRPASSCFSTGLSVAGLLGEPRRTNLGPTYANPASPLYQPGVGGRGRISAPSAASS